MIQPGTFRARAVEADLGTTSTGKEQIAVRFRICEGPGEGATIVWFSYFNSPDNAKRTLESLRHCGWVGNDVSDLRGIDTNDVEIVVDLDVYEGVERPRVRWVNALGGGPMLVKRMNEAERKAFAARMKGLALAVRPVSNPLGKVVSSGHASSSYPSEWDI